MTPPLILVGIDFSPEADLAARQAVDLARHAGAEVVLVHAGDTVELPRLDAHADPSAREAFEAYRGQLAAALAVHRDELGALRERLEGQGPPVSQALHEGFPDAALCQAARDLRADLVVVGTHGRTGLRWFFLGSVAGGVVRDCPTDVLVARGERAGRGGFQRVLVGVDFTPSSEIALEHALPLAATGAEVDLVHFVGLPWTTLAPAGTGMPLAGLPLAPEQVRRAVLDSARGRLEALVARHARPGLRLSAQVLDGSPVPGLVHRLEGRPYDLAAVGASGRRGLHRLGLGSVAEAVVRRAPCSVLVARARAADAPATRAD